MKDLTFDIEIEFEDYEKGIPLLVKIFGIYFYENSPEHVKRIDYDHYEVFIPIDTCEGHKDVSVPLEVAELLFGGLIDEKVGFKLHEILQNNL